MLFALDKEGNKVDIDSARNQEEYFCPLCSAKMVIKRGEVRKHHFAHARGEYCKDTWHYDMSDWHYEWQQKFPKECQEIVKEYNNKKHRADVLIEQEKVVFEFQHSALSSTEFKERNDFYNNLGYKVIWVFDVESQYQTGIIENYEYNKWSWKRPLKTFDSLDCKNKMVEVFLQIGFKDLIKVTWCTKDRGMSRFVTEGNSYDKDAIVYKFEKENDKIEFKFSELYDKLIELNHKDHTKYYFGCPISSTHMCASCNIDIPKSRYKEIMPCMECEYKCETEKHEMICRKRFADLQLDENAIVKIAGRDKNGFINKISIIEDGVLRNIEIPTYEQNVSRSVEELWEDDYAVAIFRNIKTGYYIKINKNPKEQHLKYKKVYGRFSKDKYSFPQESKELYDVDKREWVVDWFKKEK